MKRKAKGICHRIKLKFSKAPPSIHRQKFYFGNLYKKQRRC